MFDAIKMFLVLTITTATLGMVVHWQLSAMFLGKVARSKDRGFVYLVLVMLLSIAMACAINGTLAASFCSSMMTPGASDTFEPFFLPTLSYGFTSFLLLACALAWYGHRFQPNPNLGLYGKMAFGQSR